MGCLTAAELGAKVILVDKSFAGKFGHSYFAGGAMMVMLPDDDPDACLRDIVLGNEWIVDQEMVAAIFAESFDRLKDLESFGIHFRKNGTKYARTKARGTHQVKNFWPEHATAADKVHSRHARGHICTCGRSLEHRGSVLFSQ